ncbi:MAG TPA: sugar ABC transporter permease [Hyphomicrobiaceae bacterium]|jgi:ABC-type sugar transport system permease subunit
MMPAAGGAPGGSAERHNGWWQRKRTRELALVACFLLPSLVVFFLYRVLPLGWNLLLSVQYWSPLKPARWAGLDHYEEMLLYDDVFWQSLTNTLIFIGAAPFAIALALGIALLVNSDLKGAAVYRSIVFLSYPLMTVAVGIIWRWMYDERGGIINFALRESGLVAKPIPFLQSFEWALPSVIVAEVWQVLGFYMIIILTGLQSIPQHLYEAASIDGAPRWAQFWRITLPMLKPSLFLCAVVGILNSFTSFDLVYIMTNGGPGHATELLITYIYKSGFGQTKFDYAAALTVAQFILLLALTYLANRAAGGNAGSLERR